MCEEKLDELDSLAKQINPSLDNNDKQTLKEKLDNLHQRFKQVSDAAKTKDQDLRDGAQQWRDYQVVYTNKCIVEDLTDKPKMSRSTQANNDCVLLISKFLTFTLTGGYHSIG